MSSNVVRVDFKKNVRENNERVLEKMKNGDTLSVCDPKDTWFPPRGVFDRRLGRMVPVHDKR